MMMVPSDPIGRDFVIDCFLEDLSTGRASSGDADTLRAQLRHLGDVARLERVARALTRKR